MLKVPVAADLVFRYDMDKILKDYIDRTQKRIREDQNKPLAPNPNQYPVLPEQINPDSDEKINPYGQH